MARKSNLSSSLSTLMVLCLINICSAHNSRNLSMGVSHLKTGYFVVQKCQSSKYFFIIPLLLVNKGIFEVSFRKNMEFVAVTGFESKSCVNLPNDVDSYVVYPLTTSKHVLWTTYCCYYRCTPDH